MKLLPHMIEVIAGVGPLKEEEEIIKRIHLVENVVEWIQIDIADGTFVPAVTYKDFTKLAPTIAASKASFEAHLMVESPEKYLRELVDTGFKRLIIHVESSDPRRFLSEARYEDVEVGIALDGPTDLEQIEPYLEEVDVVQIMTIEAGESGRPFLPETVEKIKTIHTNIPDLPIEVDGGITPETARLVKEAGATRLVCTSYLFRDPMRIGSAIEELRK